MSGSVLADILIPVVAVVALAVMIGAVLLAARNPSGKDRGQRSRWTVSGGTFRGDPRQQMPHRDAVPPEALGRPGEAREDRAGEGQAAGRDRPAG
jgi:hypothetical protein